MTGRATGTRLRRWLPWGLLLGAWGCLVEAEGLLLIELDEDIRARLDSPVFSDTLVLLGRVVRSPPKQNLITTVTITGGVTTAVDTTNNHGVFRSEVVLHRDTTNRLVFHADDTSDATSFDLEILVVHQSERGTPSPATAAHR